MHQLTLDSLLFDASRGQELQERGIAKATEGRERELNIARRIAAMIAREKGTVTADDVQQVLLDRGINLGNAAGALWKCGWFEKTGRYIKSERASNHGHAYPEWRLKGV